MKSYIDTKEIKEKVDVVEILELYKFEKIQDDGDYVKALCPFHDDHNPSFSIRKSDTSFRCWACQAKGDVISLVMDLENLEFQPALKKLAVMVGYDLGADDEKLSFLKNRWLLQERESSVVKKSVKTDETIAKINTVAFLYFMEKYKDSVAEKYVQSRGFLRADAVAGGLGYCPDDYIEFYNLLIKKGFSEVNMVEAGLFIPTFPLMSRFSGRLVFPIFDEDRKVIAFSGRSLREEQLPKYTATANSDYYNKSLILYGLSTVKKRKPIVLVEGNFDYLRLAKHGFNVMAQLGSALTQEQCQLLKRLSGKVILLYDGDEAGAAIARTNLVRLIENGVLVRHASIPNNYDPDSFIKEYGARSLKQVLRSSKSGGVYWASWEFSIPNMLRSLVKSKLPHIIDHYIPSIARATNTSEDVLKVEVKKTQNV